MTVRTSTLPNTTPARLDRTTSAVLLGSAIVLAHVAAFYFLGRSCFDSFPMPKINVGGAVRFQNQLIGSCASYDASSWMMSTIDLRDGSIRFEELPMPDPRFGMIANDRRLWFVSWTTIIETDGTTKTTYTPQRRWMAPISNPFLYHDRPAIVDLDDKGVKYRLFVFQDGQWNDQGEVGIPGVGRKWVTNESTGIKELQSCIGCAVPSPRTADRLEVIANGDILHLFYHDYVQRTGAYRKGFDQVTEQVEQASAVAPENASMDTTQWTQIDPRFGLGSSVIDGDRVVLLRHESPQKPIQFCELNSNPKEPVFEIVTELSTGRWENLELLKSPDGDGIYFIRYRWLLPQFYRYQNRELREIATPWDTDLKLILRWAKPVIAGFVAILAISLLILIACADWNCLAHNNTYEFAASRLRLAPIWRRCLARGIDLSLILGVAIAHAIRLGVDHIAADAYELWDATQFRYGRPSDESWNWREFFVTADGSALGQSAIWAAVIVFILIVMQSRWGLTPGKWICRLRVISTTLRPCGFARSLMRELMFMIDAPLLLTILPAVVTMLISDHRQRIGDLIGNTVVVDSGQSREV